MRLTRLPMRAAAVLRGAYGVTADLAAQRVVVPRDVTLCLLPL